ncbi:hypothetical protein LINPERPRIM_LOCUS18233 [Linum perenne]
MASSDLKPAFAYTVVYVKDVAKSVEFYGKAFGYHVRRLDDSHRWGELESGQTTIAFTPVHQHETDDRTGEVHTPKSGHERPPMERAVENGATAVSPPEDKEWAQRVGYVRDLDGNVVRLGSHVSKTSK